MVPTQTRFSPHTSTMIHDRLLHAHRSYS